MSQVYPFSLLVPNSRGSKLWYCTSTLCNAVNALLLPQNLEAGKLTAKRYILSVLQKKKKTLTCQYINIVNQPGFYPELQTKKTGMPLKCLRLQVTGTGVWGDLNQYSTKTNCTGYCVVLVSCLPLLFTQWLHKLRLKSIVEACWHWLHIQN